jgi:hypothetical protein
MPKVSAQRRKEEVEQVIQISGAAIFQPLLSPAPH